MHDERFDDRRVVSHYRIVGSLAAGGMGEVYAAFDETLKRRVALKSIRPELRLNPDSKARFLREARMLSHLDHPHVCRVHDYIEEGDAAWLVLELIEGAELREAIARGLDTRSKLRIGARLRTGAAGRRFTDITSVGAGRRDR
jgi:serine/threonine protein kinase